MNNRPPSLPLAWGGTESEVQGGSFLKDGAVGGQDSGPICGTFVARDGGRGTLWRVERAYARLAGLEGFGEEALSLGPPLQLCAWAGIQGMWAPGRPYPAQ